MNTGGKMPPPKGNIDSTISSTLVANNTSSRNKQLSFSVRNGPRADPISSVSKNAFDQTRIIVFPNPADDLI